MGRLWWDRPALTIRTEFLKPEKGRYLHPEARGVWFDKMTPEGDLAPEPPPASTLYHITGAWLALCGPGKVG